MYFKYLQERSPEIKILETSEGFATYQYLTVDGSGAVYIQDIYVLPEYRHLNVASMFSERIQKEAKDSGCTYLLGTVCPETEGSTTSLKVLLSHDMKLFKSETNLIWFIKEIV